MHNVIVILGPTGVGKTKVSIEIAKKYNGEIINADSMQVYKELNIGTAKIMESEKEGIPHHLFDIKSIYEDYSIYDYQKDAREKIEEITKRGKLPILVGGTGLYIKSALYDYKLDYSGSINNYDDLSLDELYDKLILIDKEIDGKIDKNNRRRLVNAINYYEKNGTSIIDNKTNDLLYNALFIGITTDREVLYENINKRVDKMIDDGLVDEVKSFYDRKVYTKPLTGGIGYRELYEYFDGKVSFLDAVDNIKKNSRRYAKKQYTFFNNQIPVSWVYTDYSDFNVFVDNICHIIDEKYKWR